MSVAQVYLTVMLANLASGSFVYCLWRLRQKGDDMPALLGSLFIALTLIVTALQ